MEPKSESINGTSPCRHERFHFDDGNVIFRVEDTLFKVHRYFLQRDSPVFKDMFSLPTGTAPVHGSSDDLPIDLQTIKALDFERFLSVLYATDYITRDIQTPEECESVLKLSKLWQIENIQPLIAIRLRATSPLANQIALAHRYNLSTILLDAVVDISLRQEKLTADEIRCMESPEIIAAVVTLREYHKEDKESKHFPRANATRSAQRVLTACDAHNCLMCKETLCREARAPRRFIDQF